MTALLLAACLFAAGGTVVYAYVLTDIVNFNLTETTTTYGRYSCPRARAGGCRTGWLDDPNHTTAISGNRCSDLALYGKADIPGHNTSYHSLFQGSAGLCFALRGRTVPGAGSMVNHDGGWRQPRPRAEYAASRGLTPST